MPERMWGDRFGINTYAYTQAMPAADCVRMLAAQGVRAVELMLFPGHLWITDGPEVVRDLRRQIEMAGLRLTTLNSPNIDLNLAAAAPEARAHCIALNTEFLRLAGELGAEALIVGPGKANPLFPLPRSTMEGHFHCALDRLLPAAAAASVELWAENMPFAFQPDAAGLMDSLERYGGDEIGFCYDAANAHFIGEDPLEGLRLVASRLKLVHLSDTTRAVYRHDAVGTGDLDFARLAHGVRAAGLNRPATLEIITPRPDRDIARSIHALTEIGY